MMLLQLCHFDIIEAKNLIYALFNTTKFSLKNCLIPKNQVLVLFNNKCMKSHEFSQVIIYKVKTALKEMILRNIVQACLSQI
jgi:hypothetical protein